VLQNKVRQTTKQVFHYTSEVHIFQLLVLKLQVFTDANIVLECETCPLHITLQNKPPYYQSQLSCPPAKDKLLPCIF